MNPVRDALYTLLAADVTLTGLLGAGQRVFHRRAPQDVSPPYVLIDRIPGLVAWSFAGPSIDTDQWLIEAVDLTDDASGAEVIAARLETLMHDASLSLPDRDLLWLRRRTSVDYGRSEGANQYQHIGALYECVTA